MRVGAVAAAVAVFSTTALARFIEIDADRIDREESLSSHSLLDQMSYRFPLLYEELWDRADSGFRAYGGSYNARRFDYREDIKVQSPLHENSGCAVFQYRREDLIEQRTEHFLQLWVQPSATWLRWSLLGDGGSYKEYGDLGGAVALWNSPSQWLEFRYWSVDHYYQDKRSDLIDQRLGRPISREIRGFWIDQHWSARFNLGNDVPFTWIRKSHGYVYDYSRTFADYKVSYELKSGIRLVSEGQMEWKKEAKTWDSLPLIYSKSMKRNVGQYHVTLQRQADDSFSEIGMVYIKRHADYTFTSPAGADPNVLVSLAPEAPSPSVVDRQEVGLRATRFTQLSGTRQSLEYGAFLHLVEAREDKGHWYRTEAKTLLAWDSALSSSAHAIVNTTWNVSRLAHNFPYASKDKPFWPWGGGQIALIAVF